jgi:putative nucleotidyltransferase with HDIG domain
MNTREECLILIVAADHSWCSSISLYLTGLKHKTAIAHNGAQALEIVGQLRPQVIVCDLEIPGNDAMEVLETVIKRTPPIPVIMTASSIAFDSPPIAAALKIGAFDCLIRPFTDEQLAHKIEQAQQVGNALVNSNLYETVNRKLLELQVVSSYSEKLMGMVDEYDVIHALFETAIRHFDVDFIAFLVVQRRTHEFLYWSRYAIDEKTLQEFGSETIAVFNRAAETNIRRRRTVYNAVKLDGQPGDPLHLPLLAFRYVVPLCWDDLRFGAVFFGAVAEPGQASGKLALLSSIVGQTRIALTNTKLYGDMKENYIRTIKALAIAVDAKDTYTHGHSENVMNIADEIARELNVDEKIIGSIRDAGLLHDIGKIGIPGYILNKPGPLTYEEFNGIMKTHSTLGANIVRDVPFLRDLHKLILYHHEHYDGKGYPDGLKGEQIPLGARILHVADAFEAMTSNRPYRNSLGRAEAIRRLIEGSGKQFDPSIIAAFLQLAKRKNWLNDPPPVTE